MTTTITQTPAELDHTATLAWLASADDAEQRAAAQARLDCAAADRHEHRTGRVCATCGTCL